MTFRRSTMHYIYYFLAIFLFTILWGFLMAKFMPLSLIGIPATKVSKDRNYDERQTTMITEVIARTFILTSFAMLLNLILRVLHLEIAHSPIFDKYPELMYIILAVFFIIFNYWLVNRKYTSKGKLHEE